MPTVQIILLATTTVALSCAIGVTLLWARNIAALRKPRRRAAAPSPAAGEIWRTDPARVRRIQRGLDRASSAGSRTRGGAA